MTRMRGAEQRSEVKGAGGEAAGRTEKPLCDLEPGPEGLALHSPPTAPPPPRPDKDSAGCPAYPGPLGFFSQPARALRRDSPWSAGRETLWQAGFLTADSGAAKSSLPCASVPHQASRFKASACQACWSALPTGEEGGGCPGRPRSHLPPRLKPQGSPPRVL